MKRLVTAVAAALLLSRAVPALALADAVTVETKWNEKTVSVTTTGVTSLTLDVGGFGAAGGMVVGNTATTNGTDGTTQGASSVVTSTWTNVVGFDYSFLALGSTATLKIAQTIKMPVPLGVGIRGPNQTIRSTSTYTVPYPASYLFTVPLISTSTAIVEPVGVLVTHSFRAQVQNPVFILTNLTASGTYTLTVNYGLPHKE